ncbi:Outer-membrane lipoprotein carrier protein precursor [Pseudoalteromonas sp. P1-9]|uniref:outer membrane lipoprotein chaperone LolA n=1 Tax=Pseudoalteromonas sp. P1-9 TaxID=1710354 RepID=UPI0006D5E441|nr:outer membrane lipoprotein chaperone LolA [Pseudoalteromonas sp. P1-9]KPV95491.1 Outer-membrane lipoprotein carrier protein precursor [Pseudoalteromonas sp. P1-9]
MTKKITLIVASVLAMSTASVTAVHAQTETTQHVVDSKAQSELKTRLTQLNNLQADFSQTVIDNTGSEIMQGTGLLKIKRPEKLYWKQTSPDETVLVSDGTKTYYYDEFAEQVTILDSKKLIDNTPFALLTSADESLWQNYAVTHADNAFVITPTNQGQSQVERLELKFDADALRSMTVFDNTGQTSVYVFSKQQVNQTIDDAYFQFTIPADVLVDDQSQGE